tara:strand:- start:23903 stop:24514 length:612 start_codon:yes stop_codon:yes gene_type:complete
MYKVFVDKSFLHFKKNEKFSTNVGQEYLPSLDPENLEEFRQYLNNKSQSETGYINSPDPLKSLRSFFNKFKWIEAAGGLVQHEESGKFLFIYRNEMWDLPKGKVEKNESIESAAIREVREECGIRSLDITGVLSPTFHVYFAYDHFWIKKTSWFKMQTNEMNFSPQIDEGITKIQLFPKEEVSSIKALTYASLNDVIDEGIFK